MAERAAKPMVVSPGSFIFKKQTIRGFLASLLVSIRPSRNEITAMFDHLTPLIAAGTISARSPPPIVFDQVGEAMAKSGTRAAARCCSRRKPNLSALWAALHKPLVPQTSRLNH